MTGILPLAINKPLINAFFEKKLNINYIAYRKMPQI